MEKDVISVCRYYAFFFYPPTEKEIYTFLPVKVQKKQYKSILEKMVQKDQLWRKSYDDEFRYQTQENKRAFASFTRKHALAKQWVKEANKYMKIVKWIPWVRLLGFSGSLSMASVTQRSDIDLFVVTSFGSIWTVRFLLMLYKQVIRVCDPHIGRLLCFNIFFDETGLAVRKHKQNIYIGHEILQMKPLFDKSQTYEKLLARNRWLKHFFPNIRFRYHQRDNKYKVMKQPKILSVIEVILKKIQQWWLLRKKYTYIDFGSQVWLIQDDFEKNLQI